MIISRARHDELEKMLFFLSDSKKYILNHDQLYDGMCSIWTLKEGTEKICQLVNVCDSSFSYKEGEELNEDYQPIR